MQEITNKIFLMILFRQRQKQKDIYFSVFALYLPRERKEVKILVFHFLRLLNY